MAETTHKLNWSGLQEEALTAPRNVGNTYNRFYSYSFLNQMYLGFRDRVQALGKLAIKLVPFDEVNGNIQGYARG